jgi:hypothetical protein
MRATIGILEKKASLHHAKATLQAMNQESIKNQITGILKKKHIHHEYS